MTSHQAVKLSGSSLRSVGLGLSTVDFVRSELHKKTFINRMIVIKLSTNYVHGFIVLSFMRLS